MVAESEEEGLDIYSNQAAEWRRGVSGTWPRGRGWFYNDKQSVSHRLLTAPTRVSLPLI